MIARKIPRARDSMPVRVVLIEPAAWGSVPVKSMVNRSSSMVTAASTWYGPPPRPSPPMESLAVNVPLGRRFSSASTIRSP